MPSRIVREGLLDSDPVGSVSLEAEALFVRLILLADDFGRYDGRVSVICRRAFVNRRSIDESMCAGMLDELLRAGLIKGYVVDGKPYILIPNFNQRSRAKKSKFPAPTTDNNQEFNNELVRHAADKCPTSDRRARTESESESESESKKETTLNHPKQPDGSTATYPEEFEVLWRRYPKRVGGNPKKAALAAWRAARRRHPQQVIADGLDRYIAFLTATKKLGTEYVQQASTFFGPSDRFLEEWAAPPAGGDDLPEWMRGIINMPRSST